MRISSRLHSASGPVMVGLIVVAGLLVTIVSVTLLINPAELPTSFYIGYVARFVPLGFLGIVALMWPLLTLSMALLVMFGNTALTELIRPIIPISPFWILIALTVGAQIARNAHRSRGVPWSAATMLAFLTLWAVVYELNSFSLSTHSIVLPLLVGLALVVALGSLRKWSQIASVLAILYLAYALLELQVLPFLVPSWGTGIGVLRDQFSGQDASLRQATSLSWLFNMMAILSLGMAARLKGRIRLVLIAFFILFSASSILTFSRGAFLGLGAGIAALLLVERHRSYSVYMWVIVAVGLLVAVAYYSGVWEVSTSGHRSLSGEISALQLGKPRRLTMAWEGIQEMPKHILIGRGGIGAPAHSSLLDIWNNYGGIYAVTMMGFLIVLFRRSYRMAKAVPEATSSTGGKAIALGLYCSFATAIANSLLDPTFFSFNFAVVFWIMRGLELATWNSHLIAVPSLGHRTHNRTMHLQPGGTQVSIQRATGPGRPSN